MQRLKTFLEERQIAIYLATVGIAVLTAFLIPGTTLLEGAINPALSVMLFVTFLQVPLTEISQALRNFRFFAALIVVNFVFIPFLLALGSPFLPSQEMVRLGVFFVLLTPCIDYVVTFSHLGGSNARILLVATPGLLILQMLLLPVYLAFFLGEETGSLVHLGPFLHAFLWLIVVPFSLAAFLQLLSSRTRWSQWLVERLQLLPVPATVLVLFVVIGAVGPKLGPAIETILRVLPVYIVFALCAPVLGALTGKLFRLDPMSIRAVAFSASTRNSLVVLPLALAVPGALPVLPAVIVTQTLVELVSTLVYIQVIPRLIK